MTTKIPRDHAESADDRDKDRKRRDWLLLLLLLLLGSACLLLSAQMAVRPDAMWEVSADMLSKLDPDEGLEIGGMPIEPLRPEVMTPPWDPATILTPGGTAIAVPTMVVGPPSAGTATPGEVAAATLSPTATTPAPSPTATPTPTTPPTPTPSPTPSPTTSPTPSTTPTASPTPTPTDTPVPPPPTDTPVPPPPTDTPTPTPTDTPTPTPVPPPSVFSITPDRGENSAGVSVVIQGANFFGTPTAQLGASISITITAATADTLTGTVPTGFTPGVYGLTVTNPDLQSGILSPAYMVLNPPSPDTTLETGYLSLFGPGASGTEGDDDHVQLIFFAVPSANTDNLYFRIFDADTGGGGLGETIDRPAGGYDTTITYTLRGYTNTYTDPNARSHNPNATGINAGTLLTQTVIGADATHHANWSLVFGPYTASDGELVGGSRVFKLVVEGASGNDDNAYNVALSTNGASNVAPGGSRVFAYSWTFPLTSGASQWLYPYVATGTAGTSTFDQHNWDMDNDGSITLHTPMRDGIAATVSGDGNEASSSEPVQVYEDGATWTVTMGGSTSWNDLTFWAVGDGSDVAIFTRPTMDTPP